MITVKEINIPVSKLCEVKYYILGHPLTDGHFRPEPDFIYMNKFFETGEEAIKEKEELDKRGDWVDYKVCERIVKVFD